MTEDEHFQLCLAEECCESGQRVTKLLRFGRHEIQPGQPLNNAQRLAEELNDLLCVAEILRMRGQLPPDYMPTANQIAAKEAKIRKFMAISREQGVLA